MAQKTRRAKPRLTRQSERIVDVKGKSLGRAASQVALLLRGKDKPSFQPYIRPDETVTILNVKELKIHPVKFRTKQYSRYSGYPSGLKRVSLAQLWEKNPAAVFRHAVWGMLPKNRSRKHLIKNLKFESHER